MIRRILSTFSLARRQHQYLANFHDTGSRSAGAITNSESSQPVNSVQDPPLEDIPNPATKPPPPAHPTMPARQLITINEYDLHESFVKGSGPGGQKINKCRHRVQLKHIPTGILVESQRFRDLTSNRKEARKLLKLKLDHMVNGETSKVAIKRAKEVKRKKKQAQKAQKKYGTKNADEDNEELSGDSQQVGSEQSDTPKG